MSSGDGKCEPYVVALPSELALSYSTCICGKQKVLVCPLEVRMGMLVVSLAVVATTRSLGFLAKMATDIGADIVSGIATDFLMDQICDGGVYCTDPPPSVNGPQYSDSVDRNGRGPQRLLPKCSGMLHVTGFEDHFPGLSGWYRSKAEGKPWAVFVHENNNGYQIAPDHLRGMWIIGKNLCRQESTTRCLFEDDYLSRIAITSDRPVYDPRYNMSTDTDYYTYGNHFGPANEEIFNADA